MQNRKFLSKTEMIHFENNCWFWENVKSCVKQMSTTLSLLLYDLILTWKD